MAFLLLFLSSVLGAYSAFCADTLKKIHFDKGSKIMRLDFSSDNSAISLVEEDVAQNGYSENDSNKEATKYASRRHQSRHAATAAKPVRC